MLRQHAQRLLRHLPSCAGMGLPYMFSLLFCLLTPLPCLAIDNVTILLSEDGAAYTEFASSLTSQLAQGSTAKTTVKTLYLPTLKTDELSRNAYNQLLIAVGTPAMTAMAQKPPAMSVLNVLVPRSTFQKTARQYGRHQDPHRFSAVYVDQSWNRQLALIRTTLPASSRIGILLGKDSADMLTGMQAAAKEADFQLNMETVSDDSDLLPALRKLLANSDALLAVPDPAIYNRNNIPSILLTSYRQKIPLLGFSASYVKAGALAAVFSSPAQISQQVAEIIQGLPAHAYLPLPQYPRYFTVSVNTQVSRSLSLDVDDESILMRKLKAIPERAQ